jgi:hypothetical protein
MVKQEKYQRDYDDDDDDDDDKRQVKIIFWYFSWSHQRHDGIYNSYTQECTYEVFIILLCTEVSTTVHINPRTKY